MKDSQDISDRKLIDHLVPEPHWGTMRGMLATTFELQPEFLEMDFLPSVFGLDSWDDRSWTTRIELEKHLFKLDAAFILTEARRYRGRPRSLRLEVRPAVSPRGSVLHPKVTLLLFEHAVRLIIGSANLTNRVIGRTAKSSRFSPPLPSPKRRRRSSLRDWLEWRMPFLRGSQRKPASSFSVRSRL